MLKNKQFSLNYYYTFFKLTIFNNYVAKRYKLLIIVANSTSNILYVNTENMLKPRMFFGLNTGVKNNVSCISDEEILYPVGSVIIIHNHTYKNQSYIKLPNPEKEVSVMGISPNRKYVAIAEKSKKEEKPHIHVYNIETLKKITTLGIPFEIKSKEFMSLIFTHDCRHIAALTAAPDYIMYYYNWKAGKIESQAKASNPPSTPGPVTDMAINPKDATIVVFVGVSLFRLVSMSENVWRQYGFQKAQSFSIVSVCWLTDDRVLAGCKDGKILLVQSGDLNGVYNINEISEIKVIPTAESKNEQMKTLHRTLSKQLSIKLDAKKVNTEIRCCTAIKSGFLFSPKPGEIIYFEKTSKISYKRQTAFVIKKDILHNDADYNSLYFVNSIVTNPSGTVLLCSTNRSQIYWVKLLQHKTDIVEFDIFEQALHHGPITDLSVCLWKPIFMTCGQYDNSVRIWNYVTMNLVLNQTFIETVTCISLHPTGLYALIAFTHKVKFFIVLIQEFRIYREFDITDCHIISFSNNGHLFAAEYNHDILIYSSITFHQISYFKGHYQEITSLQWSFNDLILYSSSINGAIYEWNIEKNERISDVVMQGTKIVGLITLHNGKIICIDGDGYIKEIKNAKICNNQKINHANAENLDYVTVLENTKCKLLLAGKNGLIISLKYPIDEEPEFDFFLMHNQSVTQCHITNKNRSFISTDIEGCICIWDVTDLHGHQQTSNTFFEEILINTNELAEKNRNLEHLVCRIKEMKSEHSFEIRQHENLYTNKIAEQERKYTELIKNLKLKIKSSEKEHSMELNRIHLDILQMKQTHTSQMDKQDSHFNAKLLYEFQKYDTLKQEMGKITNEYETKLNEIRNAKNDEAESQKLYFQLENNALRQEFEQLQNTLTFEKNTKAEIISNMENRLDEEIRNLKSTHELKLKEESIACSTLKTELNIAKKKLAMIQIEKEELNGIKEASDVEYDILKQKYNDSLHQIDKLKKDMFEKENNIETEKKYQIELKNKIKTATYEQHNLNTEIKALKILLRERDEKLELKSNEIYKLQRKVKIEEKEKMKLKTELVKLNGKIRSTDNTVRENQKTVSKLKIRISNLKNEICSLKDLIQEPEKLKKRINVLYQKYNDNQ